MLNEVPLHIRRPRSRRSTWPLPTGPFLDAPVTWVASKRLATILERRRTTRKAPRRCLLQRDTQHMSGPSKALGHEPVTRNPTWSLGRPPIASLASHRACARTHHQAHKQGKLRQSFV